MPGHFHRRLEYTERVYPYREKKLSLLTDLESVTLHMESNSQSVVRFLSSRNKRYKRLRIGRQKLVRLSNSIVMIMNA